MTYQRFSGACGLGASVSVIIDPLAAMSADRRCWKTMSQDGDVDADDEADREDEHGQVAHLLARRPRDLRSSDQTSSK